MHCAVFLQLWFLPSCSAIVGLFLSHHFEEIPNVYGIIMHLPSRISELPLGMLVHPLDPQPIAPARTVWPCVDCLHWIAASCWVLARYGKTNSNAPCAINYHKSKVHLMFFDFCQTTEAQTLTCPISCFRPAQASPSSNSQSQCLSVCILLQYYTLGMLKFW